jgi:hypothetical protein
MLSKYLERAKKDHIVYNRVIVFSPAKFLMLEHVLMASSDPALF